MNAGSVLELREIMRILIERRWVILLAAAIGLALGIAMAMMTTPRYRAIVMMQYDPGAAESLDSSKTPSRAFVANQEMLATQVGLLRSETLARRVAEDLDLANVPAYGGNALQRPQRLRRAAQLVQANTEVEVVKQSLLIRLSHTSTDPKLAARITSALAQGFIAASLDRRYNASSYARHFLSDQLGKTKTALEESERALNDYSIKSGLFRTPGKSVDGKSGDASTLNVSDLASMADALNQARIKRVGAEAAWRNGASDHGAEVGSSAATLSQQRATLQAEYAEDLKLYKPEYPRMQELTAQIDRLDTAIAVQRKNTTGDQSAQLYAAYRAAQQTEDQLAARVDGFKGAVQGERVGSIQYGILQREADTNRSLYEALLQRYKEVGVAGGIGQSNIALVDDAQVPQGPYTPNVMLNAIAGLLAGLMVGIGAAFAIHLLFDSIVDPSDVRSKLHLAVLGVIPRDTEDRTLVEALGDRKSAVTEAYYSALTALKFSRPDGVPHSLFVTSSQPGEGKSTTAYAIAVTSARLGRKVLLIDADLRRPTFFGGSDNGLGLAHLLSSDDRLADYVQPTTIENLSLLPAGANTSSAAELLSSVRLPAIIAEAAALADLVVIDGPPVLGLTDAPLLGSVAEGTILVVESRRTRTGSAIEMSRRMHDVGGQILGVILTKIDRRSSGYGYGYGYGYGSAYDYEYRSKDEDDDGAREVRFDPLDSLGVHRTQK